LLKRQAKNIHATEAGRGLVYALPDEATYPDMTAHWEHQLQDMADKKCAYQPFMDALQQQVHQLMDKVKHSEVPVSLRELKSPEPRQTGKKRRYTKRKKS